MEKSQQRGTRSKSKLNARRTRSRASLKISSPSHVSAACPAVNTSVVNPVSDESSSKRRRSVVKETIPKTTAMAGTTERQFKEGDKVEVGFDGEHYRGSLFLGKVIQLPSSRSNMVEVEFETLVENDEKTPLREKVHVVLLRPPPPWEARQSFMRSDQVDAYWNEGWWEGTITKVHEEDKCTVYFRGTGEELDFSGSQLRLHREWVYGNWVPAVDDEIKPGMLVEVRSDEDGFRGAWFAAAIVEKLEEKNKFLIEYRDLTNDKDTNTFVREVADTTNLRPYPPSETPVIRRFRENDKVDVLYKDGWWVGEIKKVLEKQRYKVYFESFGDQEFEYHHSELRPHREWVKGKWV